MSLASVPLPLHAAGEAALPPFASGVVLSQWGFEPWLVLGVSLIAAAYLYGVVVLHRRGDRWPLGRTVAFVVGGLGLFYFATGSGLAAYDDTLLSAHMVQHMLLMMPVPLFLALGAPVTPALRTFRPAPRRWLLAVRHSRFAR